MGLSMSDCKFVDLPPQEQHRLVRDRFHMRQGTGWYTAEGEFAGAATEDVVAALIDLEAAEIEAIGDCMSGCCMVQPKLTDFVRKS